MKWLTLIAYMLFPLLAFSQTYQQRDQKDIEQLVSQRESYKKEVQTKLPEQMSSLQSLMKNKDFRERMNRFLVLSEDPNFQATSRKIIFYPHKVWMFVVMGFYFLVYLYLKYQLTKGIERWWLRFLLSIPFLAVLLVGEGLILYAFIGQPIVDYLSAIYLIAFS